MVCSPYPFFEKQTSCPGTGYTSKAVPLMNNLSCTSSMIKLYRSQLKITVFPNSVDIEQELINLNLQLPPPVCSFSQQSPLTALTLPQLLPQTSLSLSAFR